MGSVIKKSAIALSIVVACVVVADNVFDVNDFKGQVEEEASKSSGHQVQVGNIDYSLFSPGTLTLQKLSVSGEAINGAIQSVEVEVGILPLLGKQIKVGNISVNSPDFAIDLDKLQEVMQAKVEVEVDTGPSAPEAPSPDDPQNSGSTEKPDSGESAPPELLPINGVDLLHLSINNANIKEVSEAKVFAIENLNFKLQGLQLVKDAKVAPLEQYQPARISIDSKRISAAGLDLKDIAVEVLATAETIALDKLVAKTGNSNLSLTGKVMNPLSHPDVKLQLQDSHIVLEDFQAFLAASPVPASGELDISATIETQNQLQDIIIDNVVLHTPDLQVNLEALTAEADDAEVPQEDANNDDAPTTATATAAEPQEDASETTGTAAATEAAPLPIASAVLKRLDIRDSKITDTASDSLFAVGSLNLGLKDIQLVSDHQPVPLQQSNPADVAVNLSELTLKGINIKEFSTALTGNITELQLDKLLLATEESQLNLKGVLKNLLTQPDVALDFADTHFNLAEFAPWLDKLSIIPSGLINLDANMSTTGTLGDTWSFVKTLSGDLDLSMQQGELQGVDVNQALDSLKGSQELDLKDAGGFLLGGPLGLVATQMLELGGTAGATGGSTEIPALKLEGSVKEGIMSLADSALATDKHRVAFDGDLNLGELTFEDFTFAIVDAAGCPELKQTLNGSMKNPSSAIANTLAGTVLNPIKNSLKAGDLRGAEDAVKGLLSGLGIGKKRDRDAEPKKPRCEVFYQGSVPAPKET